MIQKIIVTRIPVLLGRGIPLFGPLPADVRLRHVRTRSFSGGLVQSEYEVEKVANPGAGLTGWPAPPSRPSPPRAAGS